MRIRLLYAILLLAVGVQTTSSQSLTDIPPAWGQSVNGLRIGIIGAKNAPSTRAGFTVALQNTSSADFVINLGGMDGNGKVMIPSAIRLTLTDSSGISRELKFFDRRGGGTGRSDDFLVALRAGAMYTLPISLDQYWSEATSEFEVKLTPQRHRISARFDGTGALRINLDTSGVALLNFWTGTVRSSTLEFAVEA